MNELKRLLVAALCLCSFLVGFAQSKTITGRVLGDDNTPLTGVTVSIKGTNRSTQTNSSGDFTIAAQTGDVLQVSYVGFDVREVRVGESTNVNVKLVRADN